MAPCLCQSVWRVRFNQKPPIFLLLLHKKTFQLPIILYFMSIFFYVYACVFCFVLGTVLPIYNLTLFPTINFMFYCFFLLLQL